MKLLALHLTNVRKFTAKRVSVTGIGDGITVVSEANEFGKSTFFDAIHALFFEKYSATGKAVKSLQPYAGGGVEVAVDVQTDQGTFRVEKRFLSKKSAKIARLPDGVTVAQDDEAERWISTLLGAANDGPAGLLWVRQGQLGLEADSAKEKSQLMETRRDLLSSVAGEIDTMTGGRRMDRVMRGVAENLAAIATKTGRKTGPWKAASDAAMQLEAELAQVTGQVQTFDTALRDRKQVEAALKRLNNPDAEARRDNALAAATAAMEGARAHIGVVKAAEQERDLAKLKAKSAQADLDRFLKAIDTLRDAQKQAADSDHAMTEAKTEAQRLNDVLNDARTRHTAAIDAVGGARKQLELARRQIAARKAKAEAADVAAQIAKAEAAIVDRDAARAATKASRATPEWLRQAEDAHAEVARLNAVAIAQATTLTMDYTGTVRIADLPDGQPIVLSGETHLDLPGLGRLTIDTGDSGAAGLSGVAAAQRALLEHLSTAGATTIHDARTLAAARVAADAKASLADAMLGTLAPKGIEALRGAQAEIALAAAGVTNDVFDDIADLEARVVQLGEAETTVRRALTGAEADHANAREAVVRLSAVSDAAKQNVERAMADAGAIETRDARRTECLREQAKWQQVLTTADADLQELIATAPDFETIAAEFKRAEDTVSAASQERVKLGERLAALSSEIRTLAGNGIEERRDELVGELETVRAAETRFAQQAAALQRLQAALSQERDAARDTYFGPVQEELKPLLSILHRDAVLRFDSESLLPTGLMRDADEETLDDLSGGTKEQIAILTRLAFARLFARQGRRMPIILDDALVYSDDDRIIQMFTALTRVAKDQQILVFSCRQLAFQDLGGARPTIEMSDV